MEKLQQQILGLDTELLNKLFKLIARERFLRVSGDIEPEEIKLATRQSEVLHYLSHCMSAKSIARQISQRHNKKIAHHTVNSILCKQLYTKFNVYGVSDLIRKAFLLEMIDFDLPPLPVVPEVEPETEQNIINENE